jgi:hypothetical protein
MCIALSADLLEYSNTLTTQSVIEVGRGEAIKWGHEFTITPLVINGGVV